MNQEKFLSILIVRFSEKSICEYIEVRLDKTSKKQSNSFIVDL